MEFHDDIALLARRFIRDAIGTKRSLKPADALHLASAQWAAVSEFFTYDQKLQLYVDLTAYAIREPYVNQERLL